MTDHDSATDRPTGHISVTLPAGSGFLGPTIPIEVRDSNLRLVKRAAGSGSLELPVGLYEVSAVFGDGERHSAVVEIKEGSFLPVKLGPPPPLAGIGDDMEESVTSSGDDPTWTRRATRATYTDRIASAPEPTIDEKPNLDLLEVVGAIAIDQRRTRVSFQCEHGIDAVPTALVGVAGYRQRLSLPISPELSTPDGGCTVKVEQTPIGFHAQAWISPERRVANGLQNMLSTGYVLEAASLATEAVDLLHGKFQDPAGAALGALLLHKAGLLSSWESWVENLARHFEWLPDGKVLLVQLRVARGEATPDNLDLLLQASQKRLMFSETHSLLIDLLRRWPTKDPSTELLAATERLAQQAPYVDRDSICLSFWMPVEETP